MERNIERGVEMSADIDPIDSASAATEVQLTDLAPPVAQNSIADQNMSIVLKDAFDRATTLPGMGAERANAYEELSDTVSSQGAELRRELESDVNREGSSSDGEEEEGIEVVAESLSTLMHEMTTWHVTWGMAQTAQKDVSHILKSG